MHIYRNEFEIYKERLLKELSKTYKHVTITLIAQDFNDLIEDVFVTIRIDKLGLQKMLKYNTEVFNSLADFDRYIKISIDDGIKVMLHNYFYI